MAAMPDDVRRATTTPALASSSSKANAGASHGVNVNVNGPAGHLLRRAKTFDETFAMRSGSVSRHLPSGSSSEAQPRRSSNFSEYSLDEARDILNPRPEANGAVLSHHESSPLASLSLAFALLPAVAGLLFKNGHSVVTDVMLLGLAAVFLHWSVTQPWQWYHTAQEVRVRHEKAAEAAVEEDSDLDSPDRAPRPSTPLDDVPEEEEAAKSEPKKTETREKQITAQQRTALKELYRHEVLALMSCLALPLLSAYLLHAIRSQLSRPSEGLVSNYNLTIFLLASELRVFSHMIKLVQSRTLHLQRIVHGSPLGTPAIGLQLDEVLGRIERLEALSATKQQMADQGVALDSAKTTVTRDVRNAIQPELEALNRAVRRYEKKATLLQLQTEARFADVNARLDDAVALAAAAAKNTPASRQSLLSWTVESITAILLFPLKVLLEILALPLKPIVALANRSKEQPAASRTARSSRTGKAPMPVRYSGDRVPTRVTKR